MSENFSVIPKAKAETLEMFKDVLWDMKLNKPVFKDGEIVIAQGIEALQGWAYRAIQTERYKFKIHSRSYGNEIKSLIGKPLTSEVKEIEGKRYLEECLMVNPYITGISDYKIVQNDGDVDISFKLNTIYGSEEVSLNV